VAAFGREAREGGIDQFRRGGEGRQDGVAGRIDGSGNRDAGDGDQRKRQNRRQTSPGEAPDGAGSGRTMAWASKRPLSASRWQATQLLFAFTVGAAKIAGAIRRWRRIQKGAAVMRSGSVGATLDRSRAALVSQPSAA
jgi:hypothetical protein